MISQKVRETGTAQHSLEELRQAACSVLRKTKPGSGGEYKGLQTGVAQFFAAQDGHAPLPGVSHTQDRLSIADANLFVEVFWGLFREGIITLGMNDEAPNFPWYRLTEYGLRVLSNPDPYYFADVAHFEEMLLASAPQIDQVTIVYAKEAYQSVKCGNILASSTLLGIATEHTFDLLLEAVADHPACPLFVKAFHEPGVLGRLAAFKAALDANITQMAPQLKEDLELRFMALLSVMWTFRTEDDHPTGKIIDRQQAYLNLQLFVPYIGRMYELIAFFRKK